MIDPKLLFPYTFNFPRNDVKKISRYDRFGYYDDKENYKLDLGLGNVGCFLIGFDRHDLITTVNQKMCSLPFTSSECMTTNDDILELTEILFQLSNGYRSIFSLSGSDAIEGSIKISQMYHMAHGNKKKKIILGIKESYHGSTFLSSSVSGTTYITDRFGRHPDCKIISNSIISLLQEIDQIGAENISALVMETCSWQAGLHDIGTENWKKIESICKKNNILLIVDDIATCGGKTGTFFGLNPNIQPDIFCLGKGFTGGYFPLSATLINEKIFETIKHDFLPHGFTYSFSMSGIYSTLSYLDILKKEDILSKVPNIIDNSKRIFEEMISDNLIDSYRNYGTFFCLVPTVKKEDFEKVFYDNGLNLGIINKNKNEILIIIPINATLEYFDKLNECLRNAFKNNLI